MKSNLFARCLAAFLLVAGLVWAMGASASAQSGRKRQTSQSGPRYETQQSKENEKASESTQEKTSNKALADSTPVVVEDDGTIKLDTSLVTIPASVINRQGKFVPFLTKRDFRIYEDGIEQEIESFEPVEMPFNVVLLLDTSNSTEFKLEEIQAAAIAFVEELRHDDRVMVVSFDGRVRAHCEYTSDRDELRHAIRQTRTGGSTRLYEAVDLAVDQLEPIQGRKAIVLFTDGVDTASRRANYRNTIERVEESGAIVYTVKYDTEMDHSQGGVILGNPNPGGTPPIITNPWPVPPSPQPRRPRPFPFISYQLPQGRWPQGGGGQKQGGGSEDYRRAARYLQELADRSGGRVYPADSMDNLSRAFSMIAEELRYQYALSYYPTNAKKDGTYRRVKVLVGKPDLIVRARDGYRASAGRRPAGDKNGASTPEMKKKQLSAAVISNQMQ